MSSPAPLRDVRPVRVEGDDGGRLVPPGWLDRAPVTRTLLWLNAAMFLVEVALSHSAAHLPVQDALGLGASYGLATIGEGRWETLVTACFLHDGIVHIAFNMVALWQAGPLVERAVGSGRMAPMYLVAGAFGNLLSVGVGAATHSGGFSVGASGAISGVIAAALVIGWRAEGWRGRLTQAMVRWLGFVVAFGLFANLGGGNIDNAAHVGGALAGGVIAATWRRGRRPSPAATKAALGGCLAVLLACVAVVAWHDRTDRFAEMTLQQRSDFTVRALAEGRCHDAQDGLRAVERLRGWMAPVTSLRSQVEATCGHVDR